MSENLFLGDTTYPHLPDTEDQPILIIDVAGNPVLNVCGDVKAPANYSFECVNNFVHCEDPQYEELQYLALGMSNRIEQLEAELAEAKLSDRDKEDLEIGKQIRRAAACLPDYFDIKVHVENGFAGVTLIDTVGKIRDFDFDENLSSAISEAIDAAIKEQQ